MGREDSRHVGLEQYIAKAEVLQHLNKHALVRVRCLALRCLNPNPVALDVAYLVEVLTKLCSELFSLFRRENPQVYDGCREQNRVTQQSLLARNDRLEFVANPD